MPYSKPGYFVDILLINQRHKANEYLRLNIEYFIFTN
jgi:hypothetical protein